MRRDAVAQLQGAAAAAVAVAVVQYTHWQPRHRCAGQVHVLHTHATPEVESHCSEKRENDSNDIDHWNSLCRCFSRGKS